MPSHLEEAFSNQWLVSYPQFPFKKEYTLPIWLAWATYQQEKGLRSRRYAFRADFAWPQAQVAIEINGGIWKKGGHSSGKGITRDITKSTLAQLSGWVLISLSDSHLYDGNPSWLSLIADLISHRQVRLRGLTPGDDPGGGSTPENQSLAGSMDGSGPGHTSRHRARWRDVDLRATLRELRRQDVAVGHQF